MRTFYWVCKCLGFTSVSRCDGWVLNRAFVFVTSDLVASATDPLEVEEISVLEILSKELPSEPGVFAL